MKTYTVHIDGTDIDVVRDDDGKFIVPEGWRGIGTALKPAFEPICLARKPLSESTIAANVLKRGTGAINVDACRIEVNGEPPSVARRAQTQKSGNFSRRSDKIFRVNGDRAEGIANYLANKEGDKLGRWPANLVTDGSEEVIAAFPNSAGQQGDVRGTEPSAPFKDVYGTIGRAGSAAVVRGDAGSAARFFYSAKAGADDRCDSKHPTIKPVALMRWLARLITPPRGTVLDPFAGSGTTGIACIREGFDCVLIEREAEYVNDIHHRMQKLAGLDTALFAHRIPEAG